MGFLLILVLWFSFMGGIMLGANTATSTVREEIIQWCVQKPQECKKEFDFYQLKKEVETMKENQK